MKNLLSSILLLSILPFQISLAQAVGQVAPQLKLTRVLQASDNTTQSIESIKGKVVVLEFWATWCAPCIAAMPHLNELSEKYKGKGVQFISVTDETEAKVVPFLKKRKINGWVGIDGDRTMHKAYEVESIPFTVVIGAEGKVLGYPESRKLSEQMLDQALSGKELSFPGAPLEPAAPTSEVTILSKPLYELSIRPSVWNGMATSIGPGQFNINGGTALTVLKYAFDATLKQSKVTAQLPQGKFDVVATNLTKGSPGWAWRTQLQQMLQEVWEIEVRQEQKEMDVYELRVTPAASRLLVKTKEGESMSEQSSDAGVLVGRNTSVALLAKELQESLSVPVFNVTNLSGNYDYNLYYDQTKSETLLKSLEENMGLTLHKVKRPMEVLVVAPKKNL